MAKLYNPADGLEECPECGGDLILLAYQGLQLGCENCVPDGLIESYSVADALARGIAEDA